MARVVSHLGGQSKGHKEGNGGDATGNLEGPDVAINVGNVLGDAAVNCRQRAVRGNGAECGQRERPTNLTG